ncbi:MAG: CopD family protein [Legionellales bacterium]|nr:CopD family protein [Legionellales bacterium]
MLIIKALHIIAMVAWFAGLFYLPRLFVYHSECVDSLSIERFKVMERRLYYGITWPAALFTTSFGISLLLSQPKYYAHAHWMHAKLGLVVFLWAYHLMCGHFLKRFAATKNKLTSKFYRPFNEIPTVLLIGIVMLAVVKPF